MSAFSYYVVGIVCENPAELRSVQLRAGTAEKFIPHVSLKGRFSAEDRRVTADLIPCITLLGSRVTPFEAEFIGPTNIDDLLFWMECERGMRGHAQFRALHLWCENALARHIRLDCTPREFRFESYRPHMTIGWFPRCDPALSEYRYQISTRRIFAETAIFGRLCLFRYEEDPHLAAVDIRMIG
jgi:hypothetical protein